MNLGVIFIASNSPECDWHFLFLSRMEQVQERVVF